jgi:ABC-type transport system involved in multi-copper enzyme maturation permease subunit
MNLKLFNRNEPVAASADGSDADDRPKGTWEGSDYRMTDEEAHRDVQYHIPSEFMQIVAMFKTQMALYSKRKIVYVLLALAVLIPIIYYMTKDLFEYSTLSESSGTGLMGILLSMMPFILGLFTASLCGSAMPAEFTERSAYMNMALPMSRTAFCLGKYLAGVTITIGVFVFAYGMSMAAAIGGYAYFDEDALGASFVMTLLAILVYTSFTFTFGCLFKRGAMILSFLMISIVLPLIELYLYLDGRLDAGIFVMLPNLLPDMAVLSLGSSISGSPIGLLNAILPVVDASSIPLLTCTVVAIIWTVAFIAIGIYAINRREM